MEFNKHGESIKMIARKTERSRYPPSKYGEDLQKVSVIYLRSSYTIFLQLSHIISHQTLLKPPRIFNQISHKYLNDY